MLGALRRHASPRGALLHLPGPSSRNGATVDGLEGFARSMVLAAFRLAGADGRVPQDLAGWYADGLQAGTDPGGPEAWPRIRQFEQPLVEAASIAVALHESRPWIWDALPPRTRQHVVDWLSEGAAARTVHNNKILLRAVVQAFLARVGASPDPALDRTVAALEQWYVGGGWYSDGNGRSFDHYGGWALHYYPLLIARILGWSPEDEPVRTWRERLSLFLADYQHLVGANGAPVHLGRSLTYRWAMLAPVWLGALTDATPLTPGRTRRLTSGVVRHFVDRGAVAADGLLKNGWYHGFQPSVQAYSGPGSPYWASKGFLGLLLPPHHPVWTAAEEPLEIELRDVHRALPGPGWLVQGTRDDGVVRVLNHGSETPAANDPHYSRLAYSSHTGPQLSGFPDNAFQLTNGKGVDFERVNIRTTRIGEREAVSRFTALLPGTRPVEVEVRSLVLEGGELRIARVPPGVGLMAAASGYAVAGTSAPVTSRGNDWSEARSGPMRSLVRGVSGFTQGHTDTRRGSNAFGTFSAAPYLSGAVSEDRETLFAWTVELAGPRAPGAFGG